MPAREAATSRPAPGTHTLFLDGDCLVFSAPRQEVHVLNSSAGVVWCALEDGLSPKEVSDVLAERFGLTPDAARAGLAAALATFRSYALLDGGAAPPVVAPPALATPAELPPLGMPHFVTETQYALLGTRFRLRCTDTAVLGWVDPVLRHLATPPGAVDIVLALVGSATAGRYVLYQDNLPAGECSAVNGAAPLVKGAIWSGAVNRFDFLIGIHAGVVAGADGGVMLLPGRPGRGKSTLTAKLLRAGGRYFSDEMALFGTTDLHITPLPLPLCVKAEGRAALVEDYPDLATLPLHLRADGRRVAYLPPPPASLPAPGTSAPLRAIVFPHFRPGEASRLSPLRKAEALRRLMAECMVKRRPLDLGHMRSLLGLMQQAACYDFSFANSAEALRLLRPILNLD